MGPSAYPHPSRTSTLGPLVPNAAGAALGASPGASPGASELAAADLPVARRIVSLSRERWGIGREAVVVGRDPALVAALERAARFAEAAGPVLVTGETGTGKELFARAVYLLSRRNRKPFLCVNCAQYHDGQLLASELFGHRKGSFTGAVADHRGLFEEADGGVIFLDEVGELSVPAQAMLLRALGEGEIVPVGSTHAKRVDVRIIAATSRDLRPLVESGRFRPDLYYRLRHLHVRVPSLRERGDDWRIVLDYYLERLVTEQASRKQFSRHALTMLARYSWPGNVRELRSLVDTGYFMSETGWIESDHFAEALEGAARQEQWRRIPLAPMADGVETSDATASSAGLYEDMAAGRTTFWDAVHLPYMNREMNRAEVRALIERGLVATRGSYKRLLGVFGIDEADYLKFMDFLRHQDLKPRP